MNSARPLPPKGAFCSHQNMRKRSCRECRNRKRPACFVECPDCGLTWMLREGVSG